jgi:hypothetical protein
VSANKIFKDLLNINDDDWARIEQCLVKNGVPVSDEDLFKIIITCKAEMGKYEGAKIFFPDNKYELNDKIVILKRAGQVEFGRIIKIEPKHNFSFRTVHNGSDILPYCEFIHIEPLKGDWQSRAGYECLISASKEYLHKKLDFLTRDELVYEFIDAEQKEEIQIGVMKQLQEEERIISDGKRWFLKSHIPKIAPAQIDAIFWRVSELFESVTTDYILSEILNVPLSLPEIELWRFAIECSLKEDRRFMRQGEGWIISPPPRESVITLDDDAAQAGLLKVGYGLRHILAYYKMKGGIKFLTYGYYEISAIIDEDYKNISGQDIANWYIENDLHGGDKVHVRCFGEKEASFRLYTEIETKKPIPSKSSSESKIIYIRKLAYEFLSNKGEYCFLTDIKTGLEISRGVKIEEGSLRAVLISNPHLFELLSPSSKLWGLRIWGVEDKSKYINLNSLLLSIQEDDLVFKIIETNDNPLSNKEIAHRIAEIFCLPPELILSTSFLDTHDNRIVRLPDGRLTLKVTLENWEKRLSELNSYLSNYARVEKEINELKSKIAAFKEELIELGRIIEKKDKNSSLEKSKLNTLLAAQSPVYYLLIVQIIRNIIFFLLLISALVLYWQNRAYSYILAVILMILCGVLLVLLIAAIFIQKNSGRKKHILETSLKRFNKNIDHLLKDANKLKFEYQNKEQLMLNIEKEIKGLEKEISYENKEKLSYEREQLKIRMGISN